MTKEQAAVLFDHLATLFPEAEAVELMRWIKNRESVKLLLDRSLHVSTDEWGDDACSGCGVVGYGVHERGCIPMTALVALEDPRVALDVARAHELALQREKAAEVNARRQATRAATMARKKAEKELLK